MPISHEAIDQALDVQGRGALRRELTACLRTGRALRVPRARTQGRAKTFLSPEILISERPAEATDRAVPGHWEGDLLIGARGASAIATLVERSTRYLMLVALPGGQVSEHVVHQLTEAMIGLPAHLRRSLTWDQGTEMAMHARFRVATGCPVYFCDPHSPWQRGSNENTNGLLRDYYPTSKTDFRTHTQTDLDTVAHELNTRPRQTLNWHTPAQRLDQLLVATTA
jgi:IS30 family transposase